MTRFQKKAAQAVAARLAANPKPTSLYEVSCTADIAAKEAGKKTDLYGSLYAYPLILPPGWTTRWLKASKGTSDSMLYAVPPGWQPGSTQSDSLLLGAGNLVPA